MDIIQMHILLFIVNNDYPCCRILICDCIGFKRDIDIIQVHIFLKNDYPCGRYINLCLHRIQEGHRYYTSAYICK